MGVKSSGWTQGDRLVVVGCAALLVGHALYVATLQGTHCIDDAYIAFQYARNVAEGHGVVFNPGERVEGYTSFLWMALVAGLHALHVDVPVASRVVDLVLAVALLVAALAFLRARGRFVAVVLAGGLLAVEGSLARWSQDGMETILFAGLVFWAAVLSSREPSTRARVAAAGVVFALAAMTRPEGVLFFAMSLPFCLVGPGSSGLRLERTLVQAAGFLALFVPYYVWRWWYFGYPLPNTFYAKVGYSWEQVWRGVDYLQVYFVELHWPLIVVLALPLLCSAGRRLERWQWEFLASSFAYLLYVTAVGGDWMGPGRFIVPVLPLLVLPAAHAVGQVLAADRSSGVRHWVVYGGVAAVVAAMAALNGERKAEHANIRRERPFLESRNTLALWLRERAAPGDSLLTNEIGQLAYLTGMTTLDIHGLTDPRIAHMRAGRIGAKKAGHEKSDLGYSLSLKPTWIVSPGLADYKWRLQSRYRALLDYEVVRVDAEIAQQGYRNVLRRRAR